ncbi:MAG: TolC family outer membrane protein [Pseudomonadota bacterium]
MCTSLVLAICAMSNAQAITLREAVAAAVKSNPDIGQAIANREATEFELKQARGLFLPRADLVADIGAEQRENNTTVSLGTDDKTYTRKEANFVVSQLLFDGFASEAEVERQASRVDSASFRVWERSEFIGLAVVREYLEFMRAGRVVGYAQNNLSYHRKLLGDFQEGTQGGSISIADRQQAEERVFAAEARILEAKEDYNAAGIRFLRLVGLPIEKPQAPGSIAGNLPRSLDDAIGLARTNSPSVKIAQADIDTAYALLKGAEAAFSPKVSAEARARIGDDVEGIEGKDNDYRVGVVVRWNLFNGGIDSANREEQIRRVDEQRMKLHSVSREVEEAVRLSWDRRLLQKRRLVDIRKQAATSEQLISSYADQFGVGQRSLLDLLDTQNTRFNTLVAVETARVATEFADYRILAATGTLLSTLGIDAPAHANAYARADAKVPVTPVAETMPRSLLPVNLSKVN